MLLALELHIAVLRDELSDAGACVFFSSNFYSLARFWRAVGARWAGVRRKTKEHGPRPWSRRYHVRVMFSNSAPKARAWSSGSSRQVGDYLYCVKPRYAKGTGHKNAQPTHPERNA